VKSRILRGRRALREFLEPLLREHEPHASTQSVSHRSAGNSIVEPQPSPFGDAYSSARRIHDSSQGNSLRPSDAGEGLP
jgi:hypothetical protein